MDSPLSKAHVWNLVAPGYVEHNVVAFEAFAARALDLAGVTATDRILDVAAGPGSLAIQAASRVARVDALDFSPAMLGALRARSASAGVDNLYPLEGDGQALPYADGAFDAAFSMFGLMFFPDRARGFAELRRVLRPGGRAVVSSWRPMHDVQLFTSLFRAIFTAAPALAPDGPPVPPVLSSPELVRAEMGAAGFDVEVVEVAQPLVAPSLTAYLRGARTSFAPICLMEEQLGSAAFDGVWAQVRDTLLDEFGDAPVNVSMDALFGVGTASTKS